MQAIGFLGPGKHTGWTSVLIDRNDLDTGLAGTMPLSSVTIVYSLDATILL